MKHAEKVRLLAGLSIASKGAKSQMEIAIALVSVIPLLAIVGLLVHKSGVLALPSSYLLCAMLLVIFLMVLGFTIILRYPRTVVKLRKHLQNIAEGEMPEIVQLMEEEKDILALERYFNMILDQMKQRIETIKMQEEELISMERHKVMAETICTACHHLGQPLTAIICYLELLKPETLSEKGLEMLSNCQLEANKARDLISDLQSISKYDPEPYCEYPDSPEESVLNIIKLNVDHK